MRPRVRKPLRRGTLVYHGTSSDEEFNELNGPAWVSDSERVAREFVGWAGGSGVARVLVFRVTAPPALAIIESDSDMKNFVRWVEDVIGDDADPGIIEFANQFCSVARRLQIDGWHIPNNYPTGSDTMLCAPGDFLELTEVVEV